VDDAPLAPYVVDPRAAADELVRISAFLLERAGELDVLTTGLVDAHLRGAARRADRRGSRPRDPPWNS
jgi:hypothetical protein